MPAEETSNMSTKLLQINDLKLHYDILGGVLRRPVNSVKALDGIDLSIYRGECIGLVGESGCGKTTTAKAIIRLYEPSSGEIIYYQNDGSNKSVDIAGLNRRELINHNVRRKLQMVFQDPTSSMNPRMLVKNIVAEPIKVSQTVSAKELQERTLDLLQTVGLDKHHMLRYPHEFSGGQRQRLAVARAIATKPDFIALDEPTSALDVSVQAQILNMLKELQQQFNLTYLFVTHHLLVVKYISDRVAVMYLGKIVEIAPTKMLFENPKHPYTHALLSGIPVPEVREKPSRIILQGDVPSPMNPPSGCRFHTRCPFPIEQCHQQEPELNHLEEGHRVACHRYREIPDLAEANYGSAYLQGS
jgi:oligopeptide/dipeptide ABC transporter ATP-binding protein